VNSPSYDRGQMRFFEDWTNDDVAASGADRVNQILRGTLAQAVREIQAPLAYSHTWSQEFRRAVAEFERGYNEARSQNEQPQSVV